MHGRFFVRNLFFCRNSASVTRHPREICPRTFKLKFPTLLCERATPFPQIAVARNTRRAGAHSSLFARNTCSHRSCSQKRNLKPGSMSFGELIHTLESEPLRSAVPHPRKVVTADGNQSVQEVLEVRRKRRSTLSCTFLFLITHHVVNGAKSHTIRACMG